MSSAASNRYQSRLFNFVYKRSRRLTERLNRAWQNVTSWIAPVVVYPAQVLHEAVHKSLPQLPKADKQDAPPTVDTPVKNVLLLVEMPLDEDLPLTKTTPINFLGWLGNKLFPKTNQLLPKSEQLAHTPLNRPLVRGIASDTLNRTLVLVSPQNEILDILNSQQQRRLQARIIDEVGQYWRYQRLLAASADAIERSQLPTYQSFLSAPVKLFNSIATWMPAEKLRKTNDSPTDNIDERGELIFATAQAIAFLDRNLAQFEANHLVPVAGNTPKTNKFQIQALIWAAVDYFFGDRSQEKLAAKSPGNQLLPNTARSYLASAYQEELADPWLTIGDLFGEVELANQTSIKQNYSSAKFAQLPDNSSLTVVNKSSLRNLFNRFRKIPPINHQKSPTSLVKNPQITKELIQVKPQTTFAPVVSKLTNTAKQIKKRKSDSVSLNLTNSVAANPNNQINHTPDWIETEATAMGYIKHPLEQLLAWLDAAMLWLENILVKIWHRLQNLLIGK